MKKFMTSTLKAFSLLMVSLLLSTVTAWAQSTVTAQGRIIDETGEGVIGASVVVQGTTTGAVTDLDGNFSIPNVAVGATLEISYMGYKNVTVKVDGKPIAVTLQEDSQALDEVVVVGVGYGVMRKSDLTGSVTSVKAEDVMKNNPTSDISSALQGRMAGVSIMSSSGQPGSSSTIRIRGMNSISGDEGPLVVIDGFIGGSLNSLNAADIASVEVLKDASATAQEPAGRQDQSGIQRLHQLQDPLLVAGDPESGADGRFGQYLWHGNLWATQLFLHR